MLTLLLCSRMRNDDSESKLINLFNNLQKTVLDKSYIQVLIKFDNDDPLQVSIVNKLKDLKLDFKWDFIVSPRGDGYLDLYKAYNDLFYNPKLAITPLYYVISDDIVFLYPGWDQDIKKAYDHGCELHKDKIFTIHQEDRFFGIRPNYNEILERNEPYPFWTKEWIYTLGMIGPTTATDAFTSAIELELFDKYKMDIRIILNKKINTRQVTAYDLPGNERYDVTRNKLIQQLQGEAIQEIIKFQARNIYLAKERLNLSSSLLQEENAINDFFKRYGEDFILQETFKRILSKESDVKNQAKIISKMICMHAIPTMQKSSDWPEIIKYLFNDVFLTYVQETDNKFVMDRLTEYYKETASSIIKGMIASSQT